MLDECVRFNVETIVADARAALECGSTPYIAVLLNIAPQFLSSEDRELEVFEAGMNKAGRVLGLLLLLVLCAASVSGGTPFSP